MSQPTYAVDVPLRWSDMDAYGHVNNVQFLRLLE
ncbi:MAG: acyl-CoA thioester hydrolase, partial [Actinomycetota bacterium]|nr:acyl-CoA thioester hydrolase [Actinomycetota bacterium]